MSDIETENNEDASDTVEAARETVIEAMEHSADIYGFNRSYGRLYGILFFADEPVSLDELVEKSGYAKSTVSSAMKDMAQLHMVYRRSIPGEGKKAFYEAERDFWTIVQEFLRGEVQREISIMTRALEEADQQLQEAESEKADRHLEKIQELERMYSRSQKLVNFLTSSSIDRLTRLVDRVLPD